MSAPIERVAADQKKVLFVDDEALSLKYFKAAIGQYAEVVTAENPATAMAILAAEGHTISVVVSDERMPRESGVVFLSAVRKSWPSTVRILTSAYADIDLQEAINNAAISRFLPKPWDFDELSEVVKNALGGDMDVHISRDNETSGTGLATTDANLEMLAVLSRELTDPLKDIGTESLRLAALAGTGTIIDPIASISANWSRRLQLGQIAASASRIQSLVEHCRAIAGPLAEVAGGLVANVAAASHSMAESVFESGERLARTDANRVRLKIDARNDFLYCAPKKMIEAVLTEQFKLGNAASEFSTSEILVTLVPGINYNDIEITVSGKDAILLSRDVLRTSRYALWAIGAELLTEANGYSTTTRLRFPISPAAISGHLRH